MLVLNGDTYLDIDFDLPTPIQNKIRMFTTEISDCSRYGYIAEEKNQILFKEKGYNGCGDINAGVYLMDRNMLNNMPYSFSFEEFIQNNSDKILLYKTDGEFIDIGIPEDYERAKKILKEINE